MRLVLLILTLFAIQSTDATRIRLLLRDETGAGVAGATVTLRRENGSSLDLVTNTDGVAVSDALPGGAVWLMRGQRADGTPLIADSAPADAGFRLVLIPGQVRDALLRLDGDRIVLDPDMIFTSDERARPPTVAALAATVPPLGAVAQPVVAAARLTEETPTEQTTFGLLWCVGLFGVLLLVGAVVIARMRVQQQRHR